MMTTKTLAVRGVAFNWLGRLCSLLLAFVVTPILVHGLGNEHYGIWAIVMSLTSYYSLADFGLRGAGTKYIAQYHAVGDSNAISKTIVTSFSVYAGLAVLPLLISVCVAWGLLGAFGIQADMVPTVRWVVYLVGGTVSIQLLGQVFAATLVALRRFDLSNGIGIASQVLLAVLMIAAVRSGGGLLGMAWASLGVSVLSQIAGVVLALKLLGYPTLSIGCFDGSVLKSLLRFGGSALVINACRRISDYAGSLVVGLFLGPIAVTYYAIAEGLVRRIGGLSKGVAGVVMPVASHYDAKGEERELSHVLVVGPRFLMTAALTFAIIVITMGRSLIELWIGPDYVASTYPTLCLLMLAGVATMSTASAHAILVGMGRMAFLTKMALLQAVLFIGLSVVFVPWLEIIGVAWAALVSQVATSSVLFPFACKELGYPLRRFLARAAVPGVLSAVPPLGAALLLVGYFPAHHLAMLVAQAGVVLLVSALSIYYLGMRPRERTAVRKAFLPGPSP